MEPTPSNDQAARTFQDILGHDWLIELNYAKLREIREATKIDLGNVELFAQTWAQLLLDDEALLGVLHRSLGCTGSLDVFAAVMDGTTLEAAREALLQAVYFFTRPQKRGMIHEGAGMVMQRYKEAIATAETEMRKVTTEATTEATNRLGSKLSKSPESLATGTIGGHLGRRSKPFMRDEPTSGIDLDGCFSGS